MNALESFLYEISKFFLTPVLVLLCLMFVYALFSLGQVLVEAVARARLPQGQQPLHRYWQRNAHLGSDGLELYVLKGCPEQLGFVSATGPMFSDNAIAAVLLASSHHFPHPFRSLSPLRRPLACLQAHLSLRCQQLVAHHPQVR